MQPQYDYRLASGWNVALASMTNIETLLLAVVPLRRLPPASVLDRYPQRATVLSGRTFGDGPARLEWRWDVLPMAALRRIQDTYLSGSVVSAQVTVYTRDPDAGATSYVRANAYLTRPQPGTDYTMRQNRALDLTLRFVIDSFL